MIPNRYLIGVDSDGTAFDSMTIKHADAFIPAALEIWDLADCAEVFSRIEERVNLYAMTRGINRFPGLLMSFEQTRKACAGTGMGAGIPDTADFRAYVDANKTYSAATLAAWLTDHPSAELEKVLHWSRRADELFDQACEGIRPFAGVQETLAAAFPQAMVAVVSSAAKKGLEKDWGCNGLTASVDLLMGQEDGGKAAQLRKAMTAGGCEQALLVGDTLSDGDAAHKAGARFYPIIPGKEEQSWIALRETWLPLFLSGGYTEEVEHDLVSALEKLLKEN